MRSKLSGGLGRRLGRERVSIGGHEGSDEAKSSRSSMPLSLAGRGHADVDTRTYEYCKLGRIM